MLILAGIAIVVGAILGGYLLENGKIAVLLQPAELLIIGGCAAGIVLISNPPRNLRRLGVCLRSLARPSLYTDAFYLSALKLLYTLFTMARRGGLGAIEEHIEDPRGSSVFAAYRNLHADWQAITFLCDSFRAVTAAGLDSRELDHLMSLDIAVQRSGRQQPVGALMTIADSLPGLGIVAAVLGVVVTMQALGGPVGEIGQKVAAALVGTFLGILLCYGAVGPIASRLSALGRARIEYLETLRVAMTVFATGASPIIAAEFARRSIPVDLRPSFEVLDEELRRNTRPIEAPSPVRSGAAQA
ncbi:MAG: flagellar motor stator protein MotA [Bryobacterales bacterium]|nr:flagellar motor stator protein MotA [Bryobacterales bacterium]